MNVLFVAVSTSILKRSKRIRRNNVQFDQVTVFFFPRCQGFTSVASRGGCTLGMGRQHSACRRYTLSEFAQEQQHLRREKLKDRLREEKLEVLKQELAKNGTAESNEAAQLTLDDVSEDDIDISGVDFEGGFFLHPYPSKRRHALLKAAGVKIDKEEKRELHAIRLSREDCGCDCQGFCEPETCSCSLAGIKCQMDHSSFPCGCTKDGCGNTQGRIEFNSSRVQTHYIHTIMKLELEKRLEESTDTGEQCGRRQWLEESTDTGEHCGRRQWLEESTDTGKQCGRKQWLEESTDTGEQWLEESTDTGEHCGRRQWLEESTDTGEQRLEESTDIGEHCGRRQWLEESTDTGEQWLEESTDTGKQCGRKQWLEESTDTGKQWLEESTDTGKQWLEESTDTGKQCGRKQWLEESTDTGKQCGRKQWLEESTDTGKQCGRRQWLTGKQCGRKQWLEESTDTGKQCGRRQWLEESTDTGKQWLEESTDTGKQWLEESTLEGEQCGRRQWLEESTDTGKQCGRKQWLEESTDTGEQWLEESTDTGKQWLEESTDTGEQCGRRQWLEESTDTGKQWLEEITDTGKQWLEERTDTGKQWLEESTDTGKQCGRRQQQQNPFGFQSEEELRAIPGSPSFHFSAELDPIGENSCSSDMTDSSSSSSQSEYSSGLCAGSSSPQSDKPQSDVDDNGLARILSFNDSDSEDCSSSCSGDSCDRQRQVNFGCFNTLDFFNDNIVLGPQHNTNGGDRSSGHVCGHMSSISECLDENANQDTTMFHSSGSSQAFPSTPSPSIDHSSPSYMDLSLSSDSDFEFFHGFPDYSPGPLYNSLKEYENLDSFLQFQLPSYPSFPQNGDPGTCFLESLIGVSESVPEPPACFYRQSAP
ncbi:UNVERIFIED_CONTAM: hypothetical protein FKN15_062165 [Acipenser sinensis]